MLKSILKKPKPLKNGSNNDLNNTVQLLSLYGNKIMKELRISVALARTFFRPRAAIILTPESVESTITKDRRSRFPG